MIVGLLASGFSDSLAAISTFLVFIVLESLPRFLFGRSESIRMRAERYLQERFEGQFNFERRIVRYGPLRFVSDVQSVYWVFGSGVKDSGFDELWVVGGSWYLGNVRNVFKIYGIADGKAVLIG